MCRTTCVQQQPALAHGGSNTTTTTNNNNSEGAESEGKQNEPREIPIADLVERFGTEYSACDVLSALFGASTDSARLKVDHVIVVADPAVCVCVCVCVRGKLPVLGFLFTFFCWGWVDSLPLVQQNPELCKEEVLLPIVVFWYFL